MAGKSTPLLLTDDTDDARNDYLRSLMPVNSGMNVDDFIEGLNADSPELFGKILDLIQHTIENTQILNLDTHVTPDFSEKLKMAASQVLPDISEICKRTPHWWIEAWTEAIIKHLWDDARVAPPDVKSAQVDQDESDSEDGREKGTQTANYLALNQTTFALKVYCFRDLSASVVAAEEIVSLRCVPEGKTGNVAKDYDMELFLTSMAEVLNEDRKDKIDLTHGDLGYYGSSGPFKLIRKQAHFEVAVTHLFNSLEGGDTLKFVYQLESHGKTQERMNVERRIARAKARGRPPSSKPPRADISPFHPQITVGSSVDSGPGLRRTTAGIPKRTLGPHFIVNDEVVVPKTPLPSPPPPRAIVGRRRIPPLPLSGISRLPPLTNRRENKYWSPPMRKRTKSPESDLQRGQPQVPPTGSQSEPLVRVGRPKRPSKEPHPIRSPSRTRDVSKAPPPSMTNAQSILARPLARRGSISVIDTMANGARKTSVVLASGIAKAVKTLSGGDRDPLEDTLLQDPERENHDMVTPTTRVGPVLLPPSNAESVTDFVSGDPYDFRSKKWLRKFKETGRAYFKLAGEEIVQDQVKTALSNNAAMEGNEVNDEDEDVEGQVEDRPFEM